MYFEPLLNGTSKEAWKLQSLWKLVEAHRSLPKLVGACAKWQPSLGIVMMQA